MALNTEKNSYTIIFSIIMVVVVGALLAFVSQGLKPTIKENERIEIQQNILYAMGVNENEDGSREFIAAENTEKTFLEYIKEQLVIKDGKVTKDENAYLIDIKKEKNLAKDPSYSRRLPLFIGEKEGKTYYIVPVRGKGLWDAIWGQVAMDENMIVQGVFFDHKGETPGLGANIKERFFMDDFTGEQLFDSTGNFKGINVAKGNADPKNEDKTDNEVDAIAGATITGNGVSAMLKSDLRLYVPYFQNLKSN